TNSAASVPRSCAARRCRASTVGSSPYTSSPTGARAIASRIAGVGWVTVSLRRSMGRTGAVYTWLERSRMGALVPAWELEVVDLPTTLPSRDLPIGSLARETNCPTPTRGAARLVLTSCNPGQLALSLSFVSLPSIDPGRKGFAVRLFGGIALFARSSPLRLSPEGAAAPMETSVERSRIRPELRRRREPRGLRVFTVAAWGAVLILLPAARMAYASGSLCNDPTV